MTKNVSDNTIKNWAVPKNSRTYSRMENNPAYSKLFNTQNMDVNYDFRNGMRGYFHVCFWDDWNYDIQHNENDIIPTYRVTVYSPANEQYEYIIRMMENGIQVTTNAENRGVIINMECVINNIIHDMEDEPQLIGGHRRKARRSTYRKAGRRSTYRKAGRRSTYRKAGRKHAKKTYKRR